MNSSSSLPTPRSPASRKGSVPVAHTAVTIEDGFWAPRLQAVREHSLLLMYEQFKQQGHFALFRGEWKLGNQPIPYVFWESEVTKWLEAASYSLASHPDPTLNALVDEVIALFASIQQPDGYLNAWFTMVEPARRWTNLRDWHELYCAGHLIEAAVAHFEATGTRSLLDVVCRYVDYIDTVFGREEGKRRGYCGHAEVELALMKLYRATREERYLALAHYFVEERGQQPSYFDEEARARGEDPAAFWAKTYEYCQSHIPVREQDKVVGHAVRAMYLYSAMADLAQELDDAALFETCERLWQHLTSTRLYLTGGLGSSADNEGLTTDYDLPNQAAYAETCAAIGLVLWSHRMLQLDADRRYADTLERALYNGVLSGLSQDGSLFLYENPLESQGNHHRQHWYKCACCPPNVARLLASLGRYVYSVAEHDIWVHLYLQSTSTLPVGGQQVTLKQETTYPWDGAVRLSVEVEEPRTFGVNVRIPGWCTKAQLSVNGEEIPIEASLRKGYVRIERLWHSGDSILLRLAMPIERIHPHPDVRADAGHVALQRGPLVYCLETADNPLPLHRLRLSETAVLASHFVPTLLGGVVRIQGNATVLETSDWTGVLYRTASARRAPYAFTAIPYYAWDHRQPGEMCVWVSTC
ncbi:MAG TPA: beta-L-arabinofuranosidase domain-containing protein [Ktedonobacterales bacterium]|nr:beta-L-arabinofuranosidase domain-containing protein [Ktedonobacterales bacterium]